MNWAIIVSDVRIPLRRLELSCFCVSLVKTVIVFVY